MWKGLASSKVRAAGAAAGRAWDPRPRPRARAPRARVRCMCQILAKSGKFKKIKIQTFGATPQTLMLGSNAGLRRAELFVSDPRGKAAAVWSPLYHYASSQPSADCVAPTQTSEVALPSAGRGRWTSASSPRINTSGAGEAEVGGSCSRHPAPIPCLSATFCVRPTPEECSPTLLPFRLLLLKGTAADLAVRGAMVPGHRIAHRLTCLE